MNKTQSADSAAGLSLASVGLQAAGSIESGMGTEQADKFKAAQLDRAAQYGELQATQVGGQMTRNLNMTLGNIDAVRAAARTDPTSPTGAAVRDRIESIGMEQENIRTSSIRAQAAEDRANAEYLRNAAHSALLGGEIGAGADVLKGIAGAIPGMPG